MIDAGFDPERAANDDEVVGSKPIARACSRHDLPFVAFSSDQVFDGRLGRPYDEDEEVSPVGRGGLAAVRRERAVRAAHPGALMVRIGLLLDAWDDSNVGVKLLAELAQGKRPSLPDAVVSSALRPRSGPCGSRSSHRWRNGSLAPVEQRHGRPPRPSEQAGAGSGLAGSRGSARAFSLESDPCQPTGVADAVAGRGAWPFREGCALRAAAEHGYGGRIGQTNGAALRTASRFRFSATIFVEAGGQDRA